MKKLINYELRAICINLGRTYTTSKILKAGTILTLWDEYRHDYISYTVIGLA